MPSLAHAIHSFQSGDLSRSEFLAEVDHLLTSDRANSGRLWDLLGDEHTRVLLPPDVYAELRQRVERQVESKRNYNSGDETAVQTRPGERQTTHPTHPTWSVPPRNAPEPAEPDRIKGVGDTLNGRFVLEECVGFGGMGTVYKALDLRKLEASDRKPYIAIKLLNVQFRGHPKSLIALQREARKAQTLAHPNIVAVYDFDRDGSMVYLTMEYLSGKPLSRTVRTKDFKGLPYAEAMHIVNGMGKALAYAHERGFVHCDFKPANVILTDSGEVKVIDFGIARVFHKPEEDVEATVFDPGSLGAMTPAYASPEMLDHLEPDPRDDIYALACVTYELLTGRHPFDRLAATQARGSGLKPQRPKDLGRRQWHTLKSALSFERGSRTPTVAAFLQGMRPERQATMYMAGAGGVLALAVLAVTAYRYWPAPATTPAPEPAEARREAAPPPAATAPQATVPAVPQARPAPPPPTLTAEAVAPVLAGVPCSALLSTVRGSALDVQGYVAKSFGIDRLKEVLGTVPGLKSVNADVQLVSDEKCGVLKLFAPYWIGNRQHGTGASIHAKQANAEFAEGDFLILDLKTPAYDSYVSVDYYSFDGSTVHMVPSPRIKGNQAPPNYTATIGGGGNWVVAKPFGTDFIVLLITPVPLFDGMRRETESTQDYLRDVEKRLGPIAAKYGPEKIAVDFVQVTTRARK